MRETRSRTILLLLLLFTSTPALVDTGKSKRDFILEYLESVGVIDSIELQVETTRVAYLEHYGYLPQDFWDHPAVADAFDNYKVALLRGYVEAMEDDLSEEDLTFLVEFYASEDGQRVIALGKRLDPLMIAAGAEAAKEFTAAFTDILENGGDITP